MIFSFGEYKTSIKISRQIPEFNKITDSSDDVLVIADDNTAGIAVKICGNQPLCILKSGEENKNWQSVEKILSDAKTYGLGRDGIFIAVGGGVVCDLAAFAASVYMRGCRLVLIPTTLLAMIDASIGGKTGFDLFHVKNLAGSFYPAETVYMPLDVLSSLPYRQWKSGFAELIKTAVLCGGNFFEQLAEIKNKIADGGGQPDFNKLSEQELLKKIIEKAVMYKGNIVTGDFRETGKRKLLNLGHTFAHALESAAGFGNITHGEAVAWGIVQACNLGRELGITPPERAQRIDTLIKSFGYECACPHPLAVSNDAFLNALKSDKKKKQGKLTFIVPDKKSAVPVILNNEDMKTLENIFTGDTKQ